MGLSTETAQAKGMAAAASGVTGLGGGGDANIAETPGEGSGGGAAEKEDDRRKCGAAGRTARDGKAAEEDDRISGGIAAGRPGAGVCTDRDVRREGSGGCSGSNGANGAYATAFPISVTGCTSGRKAAAAKDGRGGGGWKAEKEGATGVKTSLGAPADTGMAEPADRVPQPLVTVLDIAAARRRSAEEPCLAHTGTMARAHSAEASVPQGV